MWLADAWKDYEVLDTSGGEKLERWGKYVLVRPDPQVIWHAAKPLRKRNWECIHATKRMMAGFPHLYYMASPHLALEFLEQCVSYRKEQEKTR